MNKVTLKTKRWNDWDLFEVYNHGKQKAKSQTIKDILDIINKFDLSNCYLPCDGNGIRDWRKELKAQIQNLDKSECSCKSCKEWKRKVLDCFENKLNMRIPYPNPDCENLDKSQSKQKGNLQ